jgi:NAD(P)-dependent dehydrogenase (short-subunit alcohol dehydrogenase family)
MDGVISTRRNIVELQGKVVVVTGGAQGIGASLCRRFDREGASLVVVADRDCAGAEATANSLSGRGLVVQCDVAVESDVQRLVELALEAGGRIDLFCSNAGVTMKGTEQTPDADWQRLWDVNVMAHIYAARAALPRMLEQGEGYLLQTSSAAGLLTEIGSAAYSVTKHGAVAFAEWMSIRYRRRGIRVSCLCPAGVLTDFLEPDDAIHQFLATSALTPDDVAESVIRGLREESFLILPHPEVAEFFAFKGQDYDRWLHNFSRVAEKLDRIAAKSQKLAAGDSSAMN